MQLRSCCVLIFTDDARVPPAKWGGEMAEPFVRLLVARLVAS
jgi:hypothetical protein